MIAQAPESRAGCRRRVQPGDRAGARGRSGSRLVDLVPHEHSPGLLGTAVHAGVRDPADAAAARGCPPENVFIQVDGGVGPDNVRELRRGGRQPARGRNERLGQKRHRGGVPHPRRALMLERAIELAERGRRTTHPTRSSGRRRAWRGRRQGRHERKGGAARGGRGAPGRGRGRPGRDALRECPSPDHHGTTPPCVDAILAAGIANVVVGAKDPTRDGIARLREAASRSSSPSCGRRASRSRPGSRGRGSGGRS